MLHDYILYYRIIIIILYLKTIDTYHYFILLFNYKIPEYYLSILFMWFYVKSFSIYIFLSILYVDKVYIWA